MVLGFNRKNSSRPNDPVRDFLEELVGSQMFDDFVTKRLVVEKRMFHYSIALWIDMLRKMDWWPTYGEC